jgi:hypothetical protein
MQGLCNEGLVAYALLNQYSDLPVLSAAHSHHLGTIGTTTTNCSTTLLDDRCKAPIGLTFAAYHESYSFDGYNEYAHLTKRHFPFNVNELKRAAARAVNKFESDVCGLHKLGEGGFKRIFEVCMEYGTSVLAWMPYPSTLPRRLAVASKVATMDFVRAHGVRTPRIPGYEISANLIDSEYILMEKLPGRPIGDAWFELSEQQRLQVLHDIVAA